MGHVYDTTKTQSSSIVARLDRAKIANLVLASVLVNANDPRADAVLWCNETVNVIECADCGTAHSIGSMHCDHRLCPICQVRRSRRVAAESLAVMDHLEGTGRLRGVKMFLLTLTQTNVPDGELAKTIDKMLDALTRIRHVRDFRNYVVGSARNIEVTRNYNQRTWHPHVHVILMLRGDAPDYMWRDDGQHEFHRACYWRRLWFELMGLQQMPICHIEPINDGPGAVREISKYVAKSQSLLMRLGWDEIDKCIIELDRALHGRNLIAYTGAWRTGRRELKRRAEINDELMDTNLKLDAAGGYHCKCGGALHHYVMYWAGTEYSPDPAARLIAK